MNKQRLALLMTLKGRIESVVADVEKCRDAEEDYVEAMPENLQGSSKADVARDGVELLEEVLVNLQDAISSLEDLRG